MEVVFNFADQYRNISFKFLTIAYANDQCLSILSFTKKVMQFTNVKALLDEYELEDVKCIYDETGDIIIDENLSILSIKNKRFTVACHDKITDISNEKSSEPETKN